MIFCFLCHLTAPFPSLPGDERHANPHSKAHTVYSEYNYGICKKKKDQIMLRNRQLYRSNPSMNSKYNHWMLLGELSENLVAYMHFLQIPAGFDDGDDPVDAAIRRANMAAVSSGNLCAHVRVLLLSPTHLWNIYTWQRTEATQNWQEILSRY